MTPENRKILLIGWDAADWKIIHKLVDQGKMPNTEALISRGVMGNLTTLQPVLSPMLWTSIATGKRPYKHGILGFTEPSPDGGSVQPVSQLSRKTKAIWNILNQENYRCHVIGWWPSHPVEPINGVMVSNHYQTAVGPPEQPWPVAPGTIHPKRLEATLAELRLNPNELVPEQILPFVPRAAEIDQDKDRRLASVMKILAECTSVHAAATWAMANEPWDFMAVYHDAIDHFCHGFMKYHPPRRSFIPEHDYELYHGVVEAGYRFHDMMLGTMLKLAPDDVTVIICSDHGFHSDHLRPAQIPHEPAGPAIEHRDHGMILMAGPGISKDALIHGANLLDITPTILTLYGLPVGEDMDGKPLLNAFEHPPQVETLRSWDEKPGNDGRVSAELQFDPLAAKEAMDQLVALGYIEKPDENREKAVANTVRELRFNLARSYMDAGRMGDAAPLLRELYETDPDQYRFGVNLALCLRALNRPAQLRDLVEEMTEHRRQTADRAAGELEELLQNIRNRQQAAGELLDGDKIDFSRLTDEERKKHDDHRLLARFNTFDLDYLMSWVLAAEGDTEAALAKLKRAEQAPLRRPALYIHIGNTYCDLRRWQEAEAAFAKALAIDKLNPHAYLGLARARLPDRDRAGEAVEAALDSIGLLYQNPMAHYILGLGLLRMKQYFRAAEAMRVAVSLNPNFARAHRVLVRFYKLATGEKEKAFEHLRLLRKLRQRPRPQHPKPVAHVATGSGDLPADEPRIKAPNGNGTPLPVSRQTDVRFDAGEIITVVAGLPRSGTSMMMQMLAAGGLPILTDEKRAADEDNPRGYYELEAATRLRRNREWLVQGKGRAVKIVAQLLPWLPGIHPYKVVFMERNLEEILRSQKVMLERLGRKQARVTDEQLTAAFERQLSQVKVWLAQQPNILTLYVGHGDVLKDPQGIAEKVSGFLGGHLDREAMAGIVDPALYRQRAGNAVIC